MGKLAWRKSADEKKNKKKLPPISIVICACNEAENLKAFLPSSLNQHYPENYEVIVVNDRSTDETLEVIQAFSNQYAHLRFLSISSDDNIQYLGKKNALNKGIEAAQHDCLLLTDADCQPLSKHWLYLVARHFTDETQMVLGYGPYKSHSTFLNSIIQYETLQTVIQYMSHALWGIPYMGTGRNLAYRKSLFINNQGFKNIGHIPSGDDDLFVSKVAATTKVAIETHPDSFCISPPETTFKDWINQKIRHLQTGFEYKLIHKITLGLYSLTHFFFYTSLAYLIWHQSNGLVFALLLYAAKQATQLVVLKRLGVIFQSPLNLIQIFYLEKIFSLYHLFFLIMIFLTKKQPVLWKHYKNLDSGDQ